MTRDYRKGAPARPRKRGQQPRGTCAFWFLLGGVVGAFAVGLAWVRYDETPSAGDQPQAAAQPAGEGSADATPKPTFDYFRMLPEEEVMVPVETPVKPPTIPTPPKRDTAPPPKPAAAAAATPAASNPTGSSGYLLQVGSFGRAADAEQLKAKLAMQGIPTSIQTVTIDNGKTYHRVRTGTYDRTGANAVRSQLQGKGYKPMMMKVK
jgi:cell division protein FtsN